MKKLRAGLPRRVACAGAMCALGGSSACGGRAFPIDDADAGGDAAIGDAGAPDARVPGEAAADSPGPRCASDAPGTWTPAAFGPSLVVWLDPASIESASGAVTRWRDRSPHANDATPAGARPSVGAGQIAGRDVVVFDGASTGMQVIDDASLAWGLDDYLVEVVVRYTNVPSPSEVDGYAALWSHQEAARPYWGVGLFANTNGYFVDQSGPQPPASVFYGEIRTWGGGPNGGVATSKAGYDDGGWHVAGVRRRGATTLEMRADGAASASGAVEAHDVSAPGRPVVFGANGAGQYLAGAIAEIAAVRPAPGVTLCDSDVEAYEAYVKARYGL